eukprot:1852910-Prymnesium_polylepis.1
MVFTIPRIHDAQAGPDVLRAQRERAHPKSGHGRQNTGTNARCAVQTRSPRGPRASAHRT